MARETVSQAVWAALSVRLAEALGLHFPPNRWVDLERRLETVAKVLGFEGLDQCVQSLVSGSWTKAQLQVLADELVVGETYFLRDKAMFGVISSRILPQLIQARRNKNQKLRFWCAACCTGEEAYSLAITLRESMPDLAEWDVKIVATDISSRFLGKAVEGVYGDWSFRNVPVGFQDRYFRRDGNGRYVLSPQIREMVTFRRLNLVEDVHPSRETRDSAMDMIICQNVLMYFSAAQIRKVVANLHEGLIDGGWLSVGASETAPNSYRQFRAVNFPDLTLYRREDGAEPDRRRSGDSSAWMSVEPMERILNSDRFAPLPPTAPAASRARPSPVPPAHAAEPASNAAISPDFIPAPTPVKSDAYAHALSSYREGRYAAAVAELAPLFEGPGFNSKAVPLLVRALENLGRLTEALKWCDRWIASDKMDPMGHFLRAGILIEQGQAPTARRSLQNAIYLQNAFVLAHFMLGILALGEAGPAEARRHFAAADRFLSRRDSSELVDDSDGLTVGRMRQTISSLLATRGNP